MNGPAAPMNAGARSVNTGPPPAVWTEHGTGARMCSWCGKREGGARPRGVNGEVVECPRCPFGAGTGDSPFVIDVPIRTIGQNAREHFAVRAKRIKAERTMTRRCLDARSLECPWRPPLIVTLTRVSPGHMDSDGHIGAMKSVRDEVAAWLQIDDRFDSLVEYVYRQMKGPARVHGVRISIARRRVE